MKSKQIDKVVSSYIDTLYENENNTETPHLKDRYSKKDYNNLLADVVTLLKENPNASIEYYRSVLLEKSEIMSLIHDFILERRLTPGLVVSFGTKLNQDTLVCGNKQEVIFANGEFIDSKVAMQEDTIFDLASTSKLLTAISILKLCEAGLIEMHAPIRKYAPQFTNLGDITIFDLITFSVPVRSIGRVDTAPSTKEAEERLFTLTYEENHDPSFPYTDMGSLALRYVIENVSNMSLREFIEEEILKKCQMNHTFLNVPENLISTVANENYSSIVDAKGNIITNYQNVPGTIHDAKARILGHSNGIAPGHAGYFSCSEDLQKLAGCLIGRQLLNEEYTLMLGQNVVGGIVTLDNGTSGYNCHHGMLTFAKQADPFYLSVVGPFLSGKAFASPGFAGTSLCVDPLNEISAFVGANRLHNRIYAVSAAQSKNIIINPNGLREYVSPLTKERKVYSKTYSSDSAVITQAAMKLALQYRLLEQVLQQKEELKLVKHI